MGLNMFVRGLLLKTNLIFFFLFRRYNNEVVDLLLSLQPIFVVGSNGFISQTFVFLQVLYDFFFKSLIYRSSPVIDHRSLNDRSRPPL